MTSEVHEDWSERKKQLSMEKTSVTCLESLWPRAILDGFTITRFGKYDSEEWERHWTERGENQSYEHIGKFGAPAIAIVGVSCQVENNIVSHNGDTGIGNIGADGLTSFPLIINNTCFRNMGGGIGSMKGAGGIISKNKCFENFYAGIGHNGASPIVENNICYNNVRAGIGISNASPIVKKNHCYKNRRAGIGIRSGEETKPLIEQNECNENGMAGIGVEKKAAPTIRNNNCHSNLMAGIGVEEEVLHLLLAIIVIRIKRPALELIQQLPRLLIISLKRIIWQG